MAPSVLTGAELTPAVPVHFDAVAASAEALAAEIFDLAYSGGERLAAGVPEGAVGMAEAG